jgi:hypothetical protein
MIRKASVLFCDNEHGFADVCFTGFESNDLEEAQMYINPISTRELKRRAKEAGWWIGRNNQMCPDCVAVDQEREG